MISGISGNNSFYSYQSTLNQYRLAQALNKNSGRQTAAQSVQKVSNTMTSAVNYVKRYDSTMTGLMDSANKLRDANSASAVNELSVSSSDTDVLTADARFRVRSESSYELNVSQVATSQINTSDALNSSDAASDFSMSISTLRGASADISISAANEDGTQKTNKQLLSEAAQAINGKSLGVTASVVTENGQSSLKLTSNNTGAGSSFSVTGTFADDHNMGHVTQDAQNAMYTVTQDGVTTSHQSGTNNISLDTGKISVNLKKAGSATVNAAVDSDKVASAMQQFVDSYNNTVKLLNDNTDRGAGTLRQVAAMSHILGSDKEQAMLGLSFDKEGTLVLDKDKLKENLKEQPGLAKELIGGSFGLAQRAYSRSVSALSTPVSSLIGNDIAEAEYEQATSSTNYMSAFSKSGAFNLMNYYTTGMLFNMMV